MEDSIGSDGSMMDDDDDDLGSTEDELEDYVKPSFWLFIERKQDSSAQIDSLEVKFYLYCGFVCSIEEKKLFSFVFSSSSDTTQKSNEPQEILQELKNEFDHLCRTINQVDFFKK